MGWRRITSRDRELERVELRTGPLGDVIVAERDGDLVEYPCSDLVHVRRVRDLELSSDEWSFFFRHGRSLVVRGTAGRRLAARVRKRRRDVVVETYQPDAD